MMNLLIMMHSRPAVVVVVVVASDDRDGAVRGIGGGGGDAGVQYECLWAAPRYAAHDVFYCRVCHRCRAGADV
jgi:hypothetical protein